MHTGTVLRLK